MQSLFELLLKADNYKISRRRNVIMVSFYRDMQDIPLSKETIYIDFANYEVSKFDISYNHIEFSKDELKFFDFLDFNIHEYHYNDCKQHITDWF